MADNNLIRIWNNFDISDSVKAIQPKIKEKVGNMIYDSADSNKAIFLLPEIEATHAGIVNRNWGLYPEAGLRDTVTGWLDPYKKPVLFDHKETEDPFGRVVGASYRKNTSAFVKNAASDLANYRGVGKQQLLLRITDKDAAQKIIDERYLTVSIHGTTDAMKCSVCDHDWSNSACEHRFGQTYKDSDTGEQTLAYWIAGDKWRWKEVSFVNNPADPFAQVVALHENDKEDILKVYNYAESTEGKVSDSFKPTVRFYVIKDSTKELVVLDSEQSSSYLDKIYGTQWVAVPVKFNGGKIVADHVNTETVPEVTATATIVATVISPEATITDAMKPFIEKAVVDAIKPVNEELVKTKAELTVAIKDKTDFAEAMKLQMVDQTRTSAELTSTKEALAKLTLETKDSKTEKDQLFETNVKLQAEMRSNVIDSILDLNEKLGLETYTKVEDREAAKAKFTGRSIESIKDSLNDLKIANSKTKKLPSIAPTVLDFSLEDVIAKKNKKSLDEVLDSMPLDQMMKTLLSMQMPEVRG